MNTKRSMNKSYFKAFIGGGLASRLAGCAWQPGWLATRLAGQASPAARAPAASAEVRLHRNFTRIVLGW